MRIAGISLRNGFRLKKGRLSPKNLEFLELKCELGGSKYFPFSKWKIRPFFADPPNPGILNKVFEEKEKKANT